MHSKDQEKNKKMEGLFVLAPDKKNKQWLNKVHIRIKRNTHICACALKTIDIL